MCVAGTLSGFRASIFFALFSCLCAFLVGTGFLLFLDEPVRIAPASCLHAVKRERREKSRHECALDQHVGRFENMCNLLPSSKASGLAISRILRGIEDGLRCAMTIDPQKSHCQEMLMKKYTKPCLKELGLLREVTKFSGCPTEAFCREA
jgi:hypothetical protein